MNLSLSSGLRLCVIIALILASCLISANPSLESPQTGEGRRQNSPGPTQRQFNPSGTSARHTTSRANTLRPSVNSRR